MGTGGQLAEAYAELVKTIWYGGQDIMSPVQFKVGHRAASRRCLGRQPSLPAQRRWLTGLACDAGHGSTRTAQNAIARFAPRFIGDDQHDAQELLLFLLDGLHEDVNLVRRKPPPVTDPDSDGISISDAVGVQGAAWRGARRDGAALRALCARA